MKRGWTIAQVAEKLNISINYVSQLERGLRRPTDDLIIEFARLYGVNEDSLFRKAGRLPLSVVKQILEQPDLQKAIAYVQKSRMSESKKKALEKELLKVFAEFLEVDPDDILNDEISDEINPDFTDLPNKGGREN